MAGFINRSKYATILTESIPGNDNQMRFLADKYVFQLAATNTDTYTLSNIVGYDRNDAILSIVDKWVGIGTTVPVKINNVFDIMFSGNPIVSVNQTSVGINTSIPTNNVSLTVVGNSHYIGSVGIGTFFPKEKLQVYGNMMAFSYKASGGDYSEWELLEKGEDIPEPGKIIGFNSNGKITNKWSDSKSFGVVSKKPSVIGNQDLYDANPDKISIPIVYLGKIDLDLDTEDGEAGDNIYIIKGVNDEIKPTLLKNDINSIGYIRCKIEKNNYECIIRI